MRKLGIFTLMIMSEILVDMLFNYTIYFVADAPFPFTVQYTGTDVTLMVSSFFCGYITALATYFSIKDDRKCTNT